MIIIVTERYYGRDTEGKGWLEMKGIKIASAAASDGAVYVCTLGKMINNCTGALRNKI